MDAQMVVAAVLVVAVSVWAGYRLAKDAPEPPPAAPEDDDEGPPSARWGAP